MTLFINLRASTVGGIAAPQASVCDESGLQISNTEFANQVAGRDVLFATHGFNVDQQRGIAALSTWSTRCELPANYLFVGVLWPGDSKYVPVIDYPVEGDEAITSGQRLADFLNANAMFAQSLSFASHSLGARTVLETIKWLNAKPRRLVLMAGAIENDCLSNEYADAAAKVAEIFVIASRSDAVLEWAFPVGNLVGQIIMHGHPYDRTALGRDGPLRPLPSNLNVATWQIPDGWDYGHLDYLPSAVIGPALQPPVPAPGPTSAVPTPANAGWKPAWSAGAVSTQIE
jgi:hypothetical protein